MEATRYAYKGESIQVTVSVGYAVAEAGVNVEYEQMRHIAAAALAEAKNTGRNRCVVTCVEPSPEAASEPVAETNL